MGIQEVTSDIADVVYKCSWYYVAETERGIRYDDPDVGIEWPSDLDLHPSQRDAEAPLLRDVAADLPFPGSAPLGPNPYIKSSVAGPVV